jgi:hypothetical protein
MLEDKRSRLMSDQHKFLTNHVDYRHQNDFAELMAQHYGSSNQKKDKSPKKAPRTSTLKKFSLGKEFASFGPMSIMGSLKPLFHTLDVIDLSNQCIGKKGESIPAWRIRYTGSTVGPFSSRGWKARA